jgi:hypothetical protein
MARPIDIPIGHRFGKWTVVGLAEPRRGDGGRKWTCVCACGTRKDIIGRSLRSERSTQCRRCAKKSNHGRALNRRFLGYKGNARFRGYEWGLTVDQFRDLVLMSCFYCGAEPSEHCLSMALEPFFGNGVDRLDNERGYTTDNCVPCCWPCNSFKGRLDADAFLARIEAIHDHLS